MGFYETGPVQHEGGEFQSGKGLRGTAQHPWEAALQMPPPWMELVSIFLPSWLLQLPRGPEAPAQPESGLSGGWETWPLWERPLSCPCAVESWRPCGKEGTGRGWEGAWLLLPLAVWLHIYMPQLPLPEG
jgi:hypothetical protein